VVPLVVIRLHGLGFDVQSSIGSDLKPNLAVMRQCTSVTDRRTDRQTDTDIVARDVQGVAKKSSPPMVFANFSAVVPEFKVKFGTLV